MQLIICSFDWAFIKFAIAWVLSGNAWRIAWPLLPALLMLLTDWARVSITTLSVPAGHTETKLLLVVTF